MIPPRQVPPDERREQILLQAGKVFAAKGYSGTKIADLAEAARMSQGLLYRYFDGKESLFSELIQASFRRLNAAAAALEQMPIAPHEKILLALTQLFRSLEADPAFAERVLLIAQASMSDDVPAGTRTIIETERSQPYEVMARVMKAGQQEGTVLPGEPAQLSMLFWTTIKGLALHKVSFGAGFRSPDIQIVSRMFIR